MPPDKKHWKICNPLGSFLAPISQSESPELLDLKAPKGWSQVLLQTWHRDLVIVRTENREPDDKGPSIKRTQSMGVTFSETPGSGQIEVSHHLDTGTGQAE